MGLQSFRCTPDIEDRGFLLIPWSMGQSHGKSVFKGSLVHLRLNRGIASGMSISFYNFYYRSVIVQTMGSDSQQWLLLEFWTDRVASLTWHMQDDITHLSHPRSFFN